MDRVTALSVLGMKPTDELSESGIKRVMQIVNHDLTHCNSVERVKYSQQLEALNTLLKEVRSC